jgi:AP-3 complex subunit mu
MIKPPTTFSRLTSAAMGASTVSDVLPDGTISNMPWRKTGVKYAQNEIYLDIIEEVDSILDRNGVIISSEVSGSIVANSRLSGVPDLALSFVCKSLTNKGFVKVYDGGQGVGYGGGRRRQQGLGES